MSVAINNNDYDKKMEIQQKQKLDGAKLSQLFPEDVWTIMFKYHSSSVNLPNVAQASKYFQTVLLPLRAQWMFPAVWQLIALNLVHINKSQRTEWLQSLRTLRLVCRTWTNGIDRVCERIDTKPLIKPGTSFNMGHKNLEFGSGFCMHIVNDGCIKTEAMLNQFWSHFFTTHSSSGSRSPLISKTVVIRSTSPDIAVANPTWPLCFRVLSIYGKFVRNCSIEFHNYEQFCQPLRLMPNIKALFVYYPGEYYPGEYYSGVEYSSSEIRKWSNCKLPEMPHLKLLGVQCGSPDFVNHLLNKYNTISGFEYSSKAINLNTLLALPLTQLQICLDLAAFRVFKTRSHSWPLTSLQVSFENCFVEWADLFVSIHRNWNETLKRLTVSLPTSPLLSQLQLLNNWSRIPSLRLKHLTNLTLITKLYHSWDFILPVAPTLEHLSIIYKIPLSAGHHPFGNEFSTNVDNNAITSWQQNVCLKFTSSNIWRIFPRLKEYVHESNNSRNIFRRSNSRIINMTGNSRWSSIII